MRIVVIGSGAVGGYVGGKLALGGHEVTLVDREALVEAVEAGGGLRVIGPDGERMATVCATTDLAEAFGDGEAGSPPVDLVLFTVKGYDTQEAIEGLRPYAGRFSRILSLQNGVSNEVLLAEAFGGEKVLAGTITHPISVPQLGTVRSEKKRGGVVVSPLVPGSQAEGEQGVSALSVVKALRAIGFDAYVGEDARAVKWSKLLLNIIGNATSAILDMSSAQVFSNSELVAVEIAALRETLAVMKAKKIKPVDLPGYPVRLLALALQSLPISIMRLVLRQVVVSSRREKLPSLLIEMRRETGKSEIEDLNGAVVWAGEEVGVPTPVNEILMTTLSLLVRHPSQREGWNRQPERLAAVVRKAVRLSVKRGT